MVEERQRLKQSARDRFQELENAARLAGVAFGRYWVEAEAHDQSPHLGKRLAALAARLGKEEVDYTALGEALFPDEEDPFHAKADEYFWTWMGEEVSAFRLPDFCLGFLEGAYGQADARGAVVLT